MPKLVIFDIDNTLTESRSRIASSLARELSSLIDRIPVALISGGSLEDFEKQVISSLSHTHKENLYALPASGAELRIWSDGSWKKEYSYPMDPSKKRLVIEGISKTLGIPAVELGNYVYDRGGQVTFSALGKNASLEEKYAWDPTKEKRKALIEALRPKLKGVSMSVGGSTSINFTEEGIDKAFGVQKLLERLRLAPQDALFVGDALEPGGNDEPVKRTSIGTRSTSGPKETEKIIASVLKGFSEERRDAEVAYFCAEYAIGGDRRMYAGGLGVLAADLFMQAGDEGVPFVALGMAYDGVEPEALGFELVMTDTGELLIDIPISGKSVSLRAWRKRHGSAELYLVDPDVPSNGATDRVRGALYDGDPSVRLRQQALLGLGGYELLRALEISPRVYHINEGNMAFAALAVLSDELSRSRGSRASMIDAVRRKIVSTKHTILPAGAIASLEEIWRIAGGYCESWGVAKDLLAFLGSYEADPGQFSATKFLLSLTGRANAVSKLHARFEKEKFPQSRLVGITNGVHQGRWQYPAMKISGQTDGALWSAKSALRAALVSEAAKAGYSLDPEACTLVWARRFVPYKRPFALFEDMQRLAALVSDESKPLQIVVAGKVYVQDPESRAIEEKIRSIAADPALKGKVAYIPGYSTELSKILVQGADIWLNTPKRGIEACGTSGMKAGLNGALQMSVPDGWVDEVDWKGRGWALSDENVSQSIYESLEKEALPAFYSRSADGLPKSWLRMMRESIQVVEGSYTAKTMLKGYRDALYKA